MKKNLWFFAIAIPFTFTGCVSTPRLNGPPVVVGSTNNYTVAQPPVSLTVTNKGPQWNRFVRDYNAERLGHNLRLAEIENRGAEQARAKEVGVEYTPPALGQPVPPSAQSETAGFNYNPYPTGQATFNYMPEPRYYGDRWWQFFGRPSGYGGYGSQYFFGGSAFSGASFQSGLGNGCRFGNGREKLFGVEFQKSSPGYKDFWGSRR